MEACYKSSALAVDLAKKHNARLHVLHVSTAKELELFENHLPLKDKKITAEACVHHLWFSDEDYETYGNRIKWNPAVKTKEDKEALLKALVDDKIDVLATDHAPHLLSEKEGSSLTAASGGPLVQYSLLAMLELAKQGNLSVEKVIEKMCHAPADLFKIDKRAYIRSGYYADLVLIDPNQSTEVNKDMILSKCKWSPFEGYCFSYKILKTWVNGQLVYDDGKINKNVRAKRLYFN